VCNTAAHSIFTDKLMQYGPGKRTVKRTENWLKCCAQRVLISSTKSSWISRGIPPSLHITVPPRRARSCGRAVVPSELQLTALLCCPVHVSPPWAVRSSWRQSGIPSSTRAAHGTVSAPSLPSVGRSPDGLSRVKAATGWTRSLGRAGRFAPQSASQNVLVWEQN